MNAKNGVCAARRRMAQLLSGDAAQARIARLNVDVGEFCADVIQAYTQSPEVARLDESEAFAICEMAARLNLCVAPERGDARLIAVKGRANLQIGFAGLYALTRGRSPEPARANA